MRRKIILGDAFRRVYERGETIWPHRNIAGTPSPHEALAVEEAKLPVPQEPGAAPEG